MDIDGRKTLNLDCSNSRLSELLVTVTKIKFYCQENTGKKIKHFSNFVLD